MQTLGLTRVIKYIKHQRWFGLAKRLLPTIGVVGGPMYVLGWIRSQYDTLEWLAVEVGIIKFLCLVLAVECMLIFFGYARDLWDNGYTL